MVLADPKFEPSTKNCTLVTPTLSEALALRVVTPETVAPLDGAVMATVGGVVSPEVVLLTVTVTLALVAVFPAASLAMARKVCGPLLAVAVFQEKL